MGNAVGILKNFQPHPTTTSSSDREELDIVRGYSSFEQNQAIDFSLSHADSSDEDIQTANFDKSEEVCELIATALRGRVLFDGLTRQQLDNIIQKFAPMKCAAGQFIDSDSVDENTTTDYMYVIEEGVLEVSKKRQENIDKKNVSATTSFSYKCGRGDIIGEQYLLVRKERALTVKCLENATLWRINRQTFRHLRTSTEKRVSQFILGVLRKMPLFKDFNYFQLTLIAEVAKIESFNAQEVIIRKNEVGNNFYMILDGEVHCSDASLLPIHTKNDHRLKVQKSEKYNDILETSLRDISTDSTSLSATNKDSLSQPPSHEPLQKASENGEELISSSSDDKQQQQLGDVPAVKLKTGDWFGEVALLNGSVRTANVIADTRVNLAVFDRDAFEKVFGRLKDVIEKASNNRVLSNLPIIASLPEERREHAVRLFTIEKYKDGETIACTGDYNPRFILIKSGRAHSWHHPQTIGAISEAILSASTMSEEEKLCSRSRSSNGSKDDGGGLRRTTNSNYSNESAKEPAYPPPSLLHLLAAAADEKNKKDKNLTTSTSSNVPSPRFDETKAAVGKDDYEEDEALHEPSYPPPMLGAMNNTNMMNESEFEPSIPPPSLYGNNTGLANNQLNLAINTNGTGASGEGVNTNSDGGEVSHSPLPRIKFDSEQEEDKFENEMSRKLLQPVMTNSKIQSEGLKPNQSKLKNKSKTTTRSRARSVSDDSASSHKQYTVGVGSRMKREALQINQSLLSFEMTSSSKLFSSTLVGRKEARWRSNIARSSISTNDDKLDSKLQQLQNQHIQAATAGNLETSKTKVSSKDHKDDKEEEEYKGDEFHPLGSKRGQVMIVDKAGEQVLVVPTKSTSTEAASSLNNSPNSSMDTFKSFDEAKYHNYLNIGEHVGGECIIDGTPMDTTVIACGDVTCFVLTRTDLISLFNETLINEHLNEKSKFIQTADNGMIGVERTDKSLDHLGSYVGASVKKKGESKVSWAELHNEGQIGAGAFGTVHLMSREGHSTKYAMKVITLKASKQKKHELLVKSEINILQSMNSPFICKLCLHGGTNGSYYLLLELIEGGDMRRLIYSTDKAERLQQRQAALKGEMAGMRHQPAKFYAAAISLPLAYLHRRNVAYRDLKPENVMIDRYGYPKLVDFGLSKSLDNSIKTYTLCGTPEYIAPEIIMGRGYNQGVDWWALGVLLYEMVVGITPFAQRNVPRGEQDQMKIFENILECRVQYPSGMEPGCRLLIQQLLVSKYVFRINCGGRRGHKDFEEHDWFKNEIDWFLLNMRSMTPPWIPQPDV